MYLTLDNRNESSMIRSPELWMELHISSSSFSYTGYIIYVTRPSFLLRSKSMPGLFIHKFESPEGDLDIGHANFIASLSFISEYLIILPGFAIQSLSLSILFVRLCQY